MLYICSRYALVLVFLPSQSLSYAHSHLIYTVTLVMHYETSIPKNLVSLCSLVVLVFLSFFHLVWLLEKENLRLCLLSS